MVEFVSFLTINVTQLGAVVYPLGSVSEADDKLLTTVEDEASVTVAVGVHRNCDDVVKKTDDLSSVVIPHYDGDFVTLVIDDIEDDVTIGVDATLSSAPLSRSAVVLTHPEPAGSCFCFCRSSNVESQSSSGTGKTESESFDSFVHGCFERVCLVEGYPPLHY